MAKFDGVVVGGGHNGLTCAAYLSRAGLRIAVIERNLRIGGGCMTEELTLPGFKHNTHSNFHIFEEGPIARDLHLGRYGLSYIYPDVQHGMAFQDGTAICMHREPEKTVASFARFSKNDGQAYLDLHEKFGVKSRALISQLLYNRPLPPHELISRIKGPVGNEFLSYGQRGLYEAVDSNFEDEHVRCIVKAFLHVFTLHDLPNLGSFLPPLISRITRLSLPRGGAIALTRALARVVQEAGGVLVPGQHVEAIVVKDGRATGVRVAGGEEIEATQFVASAVDIHQTLRMVGEEHFGAELSRKIRELQWPGHSLVVLHLALHEPPQYSAAAFDPDLNRALNVVFGAETSVDFKDCFSAIERGEVPAKFVGNGACNTIFEPSAAPPGKHLAFWWPFAPYAFAEGGAEAWDQRREEFTDRLLKEWQAYAPNLTKGNVLGTHLFTPLDIERSCINMVRGSYHGGVAYLPSQLGASRPTPELSQYRTPVERLYLCGSSSHPGGTITGGPGYNCANIIAHELQIPRWWTPVPPPEFQG